MFHLFDTAGALIVGGVWFLAALASVAIVRGGQYSE